MKKQRKKLVLAKETLRSLDRSESKAVRGAAGTLGCTQSCISCTACVSECGCGTGTTTSNRTCDGCGSELC